MDLVKKQKEINIDGEEFIMTFDMRSIATYKELTGGSFTLGTSKLFQYDDEAIINFMASTLRRRETPDVPLGREVIEGDVLYYLLNHSDSVVELVIMSLPNSKSKKK